MRRATSFRRLLTDISLCRLSVSKDEDLKSRAESASLLGAQVITTMGFAYDFCMDRHIYVACSAAAAFGIYATYVTYSQGESDIKGVAKCWVIAAAKLFAYGGLLVGVGAVGATIAGWEEKRRQEKD
jgi:hypothetical protein